MNSTASGFLNDSLNNGYNAEEAYFAKKNSEAAEKLKKYLIEVETKQKTEDQTKNEPETPVPKGIFAVPI